MYGCLREVPNAFKPDTCRKVKLATSPVWSQDPKVVGCCRGVGGVCSCKCGCATESHARKEHHLPGGKPHAVNELVHPVERRVVEVQVQLLRLMFKHEKSLRVGVWMS